MTEAPDQPAGAPDAPAPRVRLIFGALMLVLLLASLDQTIVSTALPTIVADLASWLIPQMELRKGVGASLGPPTDAPTTPSDLMEREPLGAVAIVDKP